VCVCVRARVCVCVCVCARRSSGSQTEEQSERKGTDKNLAGAKESGQTQKSGKKLSTIVRVDQSALPELRD
jgi:hypothetical protein